VTAYEIMNANRASLSIIHKSALSNVVYEIFCFISGTKRLSRVASTSFLIQL
jgi:hypothetical protein